MPQTLQWFQEHIGHTIYRDAGGCNCDTCNDVVENGIVVLDENHANYLHSIENEFGVEGTILNYRDNK